MARCAKFRSLWCLRFSANLGASDFSAAQTGDGDIARTLRAAAKQAIGSNYFSALSVNVLEGREFTDRDQRVDSSSTAALPVVINQSAAHEFFGNADPIGRRITEQPQSYEVIGVVPDLNTGPLSAGVTSVLYLPLTQRNFAHPPAGGMTLMVRAEAGPDAVEGVRNEIAALDPNLSIFNIRTLGESMDQTNAMMRVGTIFYGGIGIFGLILASVGLAGVTAYSVARRRKEIGIRMALGARQRQVLRLVLREGSALVAVGTVLGFAGAVGAARRHVVASERIFAGIQNGRERSAADLRRAAVAGRAGNAGLLRSCAPIH